MGFSVIYRKRSQCEILKGEILFDRGQQLLIYQIPDGKSLVEVVACFATAAAATKVVSRCDYAICHFSLTRQRQPVGRLFGAVVLFPVSSGCQEILNKSASRSSSSSK
jgi:hypothetical protein